MKYYYRYNIYNMLHIGYICNTSIYSGIITIDIVITYIIS